MIINIDDMGKALDPYLSNNLPVEGGDDVLLRQYSENLDLKEKLDYVASLCGIKALTFELELLENKFQTVLTSAKRIDKILGGVQRISYLSQALECYHAG